MPLIYQHTQRVTRATRGMLQGWRARTAPRWDGSQEAKEVKKKGSSCLVDKSLFRSPDSPMNAYLCVLPGEWRALSLRQPRSLTIIAPPSSHRSSSCVHIDIIIPPSCYSLILSISSTVFDLVGPKPTCLGLSKMIAQPRALMMTHTLSSHFASRAPITVIPENQPLAYYLSLLPLPPSGSVRRVTHIALAVRRA